MIALVNTIRFDDESEYLTEVTYRFCPRGGSPSTVHWFVQHPGAVEAERLFMETSPSYRSPVRYHYSTIRKAMLRDFSKTPSATPLIAPKHQLGILRDFLGEPSEQRIPTSFIALEEAIGWSFAQNTVAELETARFHTLLRKDSSWPD